MSLEPHLPLGYLHSGLVPPLWLFLRDLLDCPGLAPFAAGSLGGFLASSLAMQPEGCETRRRIFFGSL